MRKGRGDIKGQRIRYITKKIGAKIEENANYTDTLKKTNLAEFDHLTRLLYKDELPKLCAECGEIEDLHIHHIRYKFPIVKKDLVRLCRQCHTLEHQKIVKKFP